MLTLNRTKIADALGAGKGAGEAIKIGEQITVKGWVRTRRGNKNVAFIALNDGSTIHNIQVVAEPAVFGDELLGRISTGACLRATGLLVESLGGGQPVELRAQEIEIYGEADPADYPLQKKGHSLEFLREIAYLRPRTNTFGAVMRVRHAMAFAIHKYFDERGFYYMHTPIITASDAEGAGAMFRVTTLDAETPPRGEDGRTDYSKDFFGKQTSLTVSGQLEGELGALALGQIYTFGPTFRAENSNTPRHLAEFWMIEPEAAFYGLEEDMNLAEDFLKYLIGCALEHCADDLAFLEKMYDEELTARLRTVVENDFVRLDYTEGIEILRAAVAGGHKFEFPVDWGLDLQSEHERYLVERHFKKPVILVNYPAAIKAFYMKQNAPDAAGRETVQAMDVLFPRIGEIIGGSVREENYTKLKTKIKALGMSESELWWYLDTRRWGSAPHAGFGLGFERLMLFVTGMANIRDVIPFPRTPGNAEF